METAQTIIITNDCFNAYARGFGNTEVLTAMQTEWFAVPVLTGIGTVTCLEPSHHNQPHELANDVLTVSCAVQLFYAYRIYVLSSKFLYAAAVCFVRGSPLWRRGFTDTNLQFSATQLVMSIITGVQSFRAGTFMHLARNVHISEAVCI